MHNYQRSLKEPTAAVLSAADSTARQYSSNLERALAAMLLVSHSSLFRVVDDSNCWFSLAKVKAQLHQIGERSDNDDVEANAQAQATLNRAYTTSESEPPL